MKQFCFYNVKCAIRGPLARRLASYVNREIALGDKPKVTVRGSEKNPALVGYADQLVDVALRYEEDLQDMLNLVFQSRPTGELVSFNRLLFQSKSMEAVTNTLAYIGRQARHQTLYYAFSCGSLGPNPLTWRVARVTGVAVTVDSKAGSDACLRFSDLTALSWHATAKLSTLRISQ